MTKMFKLLVKEAVLEALNEFVNGGVALAAEDPEPNSDTSKPADKNTTDKEPASGKGGASANTSGGGLNNGRPIPDAGVGAFSLRK